jgi:hypothetical protein
MTSESINVSIPKGYGPGDIPGDYPWLKSLWLILPSSPTETQSASIKTLRSKLRELNDVSISDVKVQDVRGFGGLIIPLIPTKDIAGLYRRSHRARTAVIAFGPVRVLLDISEQPSAKGCISLERFIRYKCSYSLITQPSEVDNALGGALSWVNSIHCEGPRDPRCLPMAIFAPREDYLLNTSRERREFTRSHKSSRSNNAISDDFARMWQFGPDHTFELLQVGGCTLPIGFHWDVQAARDSIIANGWERWRLPGKGHTNIHPDALIRGGNATKTHPIASEKRQPKSLKTPRAYRQRKAR